MRRSRNRALLAILAALVLLFGACSSRDDDSASSGGDGGGGEDGAEVEGIDTSECASDPTAEIEGDTIKIVSSYPQSGLTAAFAEIARGWTAYFEKVNAEGGVTIGDRTFQLEYEDLDDEYNPQQTASNIEELVGTDGEGAFAVFSVVGTANNINIRDFLGDLCVPDLFAATGSVAWGNPDYPWLTGSTLSPYSLESQAFVQYLEENQPGAKVGMLRQADEFGETYEESFRNAIEGTDIELVEVQEYPVGSDEVSSQVTALAGSGADAFFNGGTLLACPSALTAQQQEGWDVPTWVSGTCISKTLTGIAGAAADGVISMTNLKDPQNPKYDDDPDMVEFQEVVAEYASDFKGRELDPENAIIGYGYTQAELFVMAMEEAEAPTRLAIMDSVRNMEDVSTGLMLDGVSVTNGPEDNFLGETVQLVQYDAAEVHFDEIGELIDFEGQTAELTPEELING
ncbi:ABC transporter substrate-binding protein [Iamia majanohamensis]|uniref:ABC transporter substrate-binding protein n=1 Tax=Iamia majanohamensis TaxID=467976 RepID=A0AAE9Y6F3_9ACTN|nr:ABC transporter substrate-binding protein [Iamia majanohamensis]WCO67549.1 ABC transporter substrate-binding protein [Iamia majanohamensis]